MALLEGPRAARRAVGVADVVQAPADLHLGGGEVAGRYVVGAGQRLRDAVGARGRVVGVDVPVALGDVQRVEAHELVRRSRTPAAAPSRWCAGPRPRGPPVRRGGSGAGPQGSSLGVVALLPVVAAGDRRTTIRQLVLRERGLVRTGGQGRLGGAGGATHCHQADLVGVERRLDDASGHCDTGRRSGDRRHHHGALDGTRAGAAYGLGTVLGGAVLRDVLGTNRQNRTHGGRGCMQRPVRVTNRSRSTMTETGGACKPNGGTRGPNLRETRHIGASGVTGITLFPRLPGGPRCGFTREGLRHGKAPL